MAGVDTIYATAAQVRAVLPSTYTTAQDAIFQTLLKRASRLIDAELKREPGAFAISTASTRFYNGSGKREQWVGEMAEEPESVAVAESGDVSDYTTWATSDYFAWPYNAAQEGIPYHRLDIDTLNGTKVSWFAYPKSVRVFTKWGFSTQAPPEIEQAVITQTVRWYKRGQQNFQDVGSISQLDQLQYVKRLDPDVAEIISVPKFAKVSI